MPQPSTPDEALAALLALQDQLERWQDRDLNEADTRAKIIDVVFKQVLGWEEGAVSREDRTIDGDYTDYRFQSSDNGFVVEAKRQGIYFDMPKGKVYPARRDGVLSRSPGLHAALTQVVDYCRQTGMSVGVACNGTQLAVTLAYTPIGTVYDTILFDGLGSIASQFILFWSLLAPTSNSQRVLEELVRRSDSLRTPPQFSGRLIDELNLPDDVINRNPVDAALAPVIRLYFSDMTHETQKEVLRQAYVPTGRQTNYEKQLDELLEDRNPELGHPVETIETTKKGAAKIDASLHAEIEPADPEGNVLLLVGGVGAGKTTFAHRYFSFLLEDQLQGRVTPVFIDFTKVGEENTEVGAYVDNELRHQLESGHSGLDLESWATLQQIYEPEIARLRNGVLAPLFKSDRDRFEQAVSEDLRKWIDQSELHAAHLVRYLAKRHSINVVIVFDNADQLSQEFQHRVLKLAFQKCRTWKVLGILALREETYWRFRNTPPFDAYHRYAFHIAAPRIANVLSRRLELAKKDVGPQLVTVTSRSGVDFANIKIGDFLQIIVDSFLGDDKRNITLLEALSTNDIRQALDMFANFLTSGHTNTDEYIKAYVQGGYIVPFHHVFRSVALAERRYFDSTRSLIDNLFSVEDDGYYSHFQKIRLLRYLYGMRQIDAAPGRGFVEVAKLAQDFRAIIGDEPATRRLLDPLLRHRLVESANGYRVLGEEADLVRVTSAGYYYLTNLITEFSYLDLVTTDTPIKSRQWYDKLRQVAFEGIRLRAGVKDRVAKVDVFLSYLQEEEDTESADLNGAGLPTAVTAPIVPEMIEQFEATKKIIIRQAEKYGRDKPRPGDV